MHFYTLKWTLWKGNYENNSIPKSIRKDTIVENYPWRSKIYIIKNTKHWWKKMKEDINGSTSHVLGLEDFIWLKMPTLGLPWCLRIHLPMQGTRVWLLLREDSTCHRATKPMCHNWWAGALEFLCSQQEKPLEGEAMQEASLQLESSLCSLQLEKVGAQQWRAWAPGQRPNTAKTFF